MATCVTQVSVIKMLAKGVLKTWGHMGTELSSAFPQSVCVFSKVPCKWTSLFKWDVFVQRHRQHRSQWICCFLIQICIKFSWLNSRLTLKATLTSLCSNMATINMEDQWWTASGQIMKFDIISIWGDIFPKDVAATSRCV